MKRLSSVVLAGTLLGAVATGLVPGAAQANTKTTAPGCAPGTFDDTDQVVGTINMTIEKEMSVVRHAIKKATLNPGDSQTKEATTSSGLLSRTTLGRSADGNTYTFELDLAQIDPNPTFTVITTGSRTDAGIVNAVHTTNEQVSVDYDARRSFIPASKPTGRFDATIVDVKDPSKPVPGRRHTLNVGFTGITVKPGDPHGPRTGSYTHIGEAAIGGSLDYRGSIPVPCPTGPASGPVEVKVQRKHVDDAGGERTYRRDAVATGGSLATGEQAISFECGSKPPKGAATPAPASYVVKKIEAADGSSLSFHIKLKNESGPNCNPAFGALVSATDNTSDWDFSQPVTFPGAW
jgi:hypothetical protein